MDSTAAQRSDPGPWSRAARSRCALLMAGCRAPGRRAVASLTPDADPLHRGGPVPPALVETARRLLGHPVETALREAAADGWRWSVPADAGYPEALGHTADPPLGLFRRGEWSPAPVVAVVGSRKATTYGVQVARMLAGELARAGVVIVSGMARGIDRAAHEGALDAGGLTWAVWGAGPGRVYPAEHRHLAARIVDQGGVLLSEYLPGTPPRRHHFPERNRIIAGLAAAVIVVEAAARSGALSTARLALDEGREVMAVPGSIFAATSVGPNTLLRLGARPVLSPRDVLEALELPAALPVTEGAEDPVVAGLPPGRAIAVDDLAATLDMPPSALHHRLLELELAGLAERTTDGRYRRTSGSPAAE